MNGIFNKSSNSTNYKAQSSEKLKALIWCNQLTLWWLPLLQYSPTEGSISGLSRFPSLLVLHLKCIKRRFEYKLEFTTSRPKDYIYIVTYRNDLKIDCRHARKTFLGRAFPCNQWFSFIKQTSLTHVFVA